jgi:hypothetical protein
MQLCFQTVQYVPLPVLTPLGYRPTLLRLADCDVSKFDVRSIATLIVMSLDARLLQERCLNNVMLVDLQGYTMGHYTKVAPTQALVRKALLCIQDAFPLRLAQVHLLNVPPFIGNVLNLFRPFVKEKFYNKVRCSVNPPVGLAHHKACTYTGQHKTEKCGHTSMPRAGFKPTIPVS